MNSSMPADRIVWRDLAFALVATAGFFVVCLSLDLTEAWFVWSRAYEAWEVDELPFVLFFAGLASTWFAYRRLRETLALRQRGEALIKELAEEVGRRSLMEEALRDSERRFKDFAASSADRFWEMDADLRFTWIYDPGRSHPSAPFERLFGRTRWEWADADPERDPVWRRHRADLLMRRPFRDFEYAITDDAGDRNWWRVSGVPVFATDGTFQGYRGVSCESTAQYRIQEQLRRRHRLEAVGQLTGGIAHDFNNILASTSINAGILEGRIRHDAKGRLLVREIKKAVDRGKSLTGRLLAFSRQQMLLPTTSDVAALIGDLAEMLRRTLGETVDLRVVHTPDLWPAHVDPYQLENALVNLAINARDAMPSDGTVVIETANVTIDSAVAARQEDVMPGCYVMVAVRDTGTGMSHEVRKKAFEPFFTTKDIGEGSGLGLSMVYGFVTQSGGGIKIDSELGQGTTVTLYLPRSETETRAPADEATAQPNAARAIAPAPPAAGIAHARQA